MVKIGSKAPANVHTFFPRPPQIVSLCSLDFIPGRTHVLVSKVTRQTTRRPVEGVSPPTNP
jgi:hypothetical protein